MQDQIIETTEATPRRYRCRHIFTDGHRCGSPCLRGEELCYYHHTTCSSGSAPPHYSVFALPLPEDRSAIQSAIGEVLQRVATLSIDTKRAGLLLYGLQIASLNLPKIDPADHDAAPVEQVVVHPSLGRLAPRAIVGAPEEVVEEAEEIPEEEPGTEAREEKREEEVEEQGFSRYTTAELEGVYPSRHDFDTNFSPYS